MPRRASPGPNEMLADRLHSVAIRLLRSVRVEDEASGLHPARLSALSVVVYAGPLRLGDLARAEQVRPPTMTQIVHALERDGLVERLPDEEDRRAVRVRATPRGRALLEKGRRRRLRRLALELEQLSPGERAAVERAVEALRRLFVVPRRERPGREGPRRGSPRRGRAR